MNAKGMTDLELVKRVKGVFSKIAENREYIVELRRRFAALPRGRANIEGCKTWAEFCQTHLHRTPRHIRKIVEQVKMTASPKPPRPAILPTGTYRVIYADPPWRYDSNLPFNYGPATRHYPTVPVQEICEMRLPAISPDAVLFLWTPVPLLEHGLSVIRAWGFEYKTQFVWDKVKHNCGRYNSLRHELLLLAVRGSCAPYGMHIDAGGAQRVKLIDSVQSIARTEHSRKPELFREIIDTMYPTGLRVELFARGALPKGWHGWGHEYQQRAAAD